MPCALTLMLMVAVAPAAEPSPATDIAAKLISERAQEFSKQGRTVQGDQLHALADALRNGNVTLADAALVMQIAGPVPTTQAPVLTAEQKRQSTIAAATATAILDGETPPANSAPTTPPSVPKSLDTPPTATPTDSVVSPLTPPPIPVATTVLTASRVGEDKALLVMIGAGNDQDIKSGQRFVVRRGDDQLAVISATQVKANMTICIAIAGTIKDDVELRPGDTVLSEELKP